MTRLQASATQVRKLEILVNISRHFGASLADALHQLRYWFYKVAINQIVPVLFRFLVPVQDPSSPLTEMTFLDDFLSGVTSLIRQTNFASNVSAQVNYSCSCRFSHQPYAFRVVDCSMFCHVFFFLSVTQESHT